MSEKKILFMTARKQLAHTFWNETGAKKAKEYGFKVDVPAWDEDLTDCDWSKKLADYDAIVTTWGSPLCSAEFLKAATKAKIVGHCAGSVVAVVDDSTFTTDIKVTTSNPIMAEAVAEWSLLATMLAQRNLQAYAKLRANESMNWKQTGNMRDLKNMTIGLWGMGDTTKHLLKMLAPLRPGRVLVASNHSSEEELNKYGATKGTLEELLKESDIFHCLVGVSKENFLRIGEKEFAMLKDGATFINGGRARLTQEEPLLKELQSGRISAILDVFHEEPLPEDAPLNKLANVILTPHNAGYTGRDRFLPFLLDEFNRYFTGKPMESEITQKRFSTMTNERMR